MQRNEFLFKCANIFDKKVLSFAHIRGMCAIKRGAEREPEKAGKAFGGRRTANLHPPQPKGNTHPNQKEYPPQPSLREGCGGSSLWLWWVVRCCVEDVRRTIPSSMGSCRATPQTVQARLSGARCRQAGCTVAGGGCRRRSKGRKSEAAEAAR